MKVGDAVKLNWWRKGLASRIGVDEDAVGIIVARRMYNKPDGTPNGDFTRHTKFQVLFSNNPQWLEDVDLVVVNADR